MREVITNTPALQSVIGSVLANSPYNITGPTQIRGCNQVEYMVVISNTGTPWTWTCSSNLTFIGGYSSTGIFKIAICPSYGATYSAGWVAVHLNGVEVARKIVGVGDVDIVAVSAFPNPASDLLNIEIEAPIAIASPLSIQQQAPPAGLNFSPPILQQPVYEVKIFNSTTGSLVYENFISSTSFQIDVSSLPNGVYILQIYDGSDTPPQTQNIVVSH
jgi:hypothetical protein